MSESTAEKLLQYLPHGEGTIFIQENISSQNIQNIHELQVVNRQISSYCCSTIISDSHHCSVVVVFFCTTP